MCIPQWIKIISGFSVIFLCNSFAVNSLKANYPIPSNCDLNIPLQPIGTTTYSFDITGESGLLGIDIFLESISFKIEHEYTNDLSLELESPSGVVVELFSHVGGAADDFGAIDEVNTCDSTTNLLSVYSAGYCEAFYMDQGSAPFIGSFLPDQALSELWDNTSPNGTWSLRIHDNHAEHTGTLIHFQLNFAPSQCIRPIVTSNYYNGVGDLLLLLEEENSDSILVEWGSPGFLPGQGAVPGASQGVLLIPYSDTITLSDLSPFTEYDIFIRKQCEDQSWSYNSCPLGVLTPCEQGVPTIESDFDNEDLCTSDCDQDCTLIGIWRNFDSGDRMDWSVRNGGANLGSASSAGSGRYLYMDDKCFGKDSTLLYSSCIESISNDPSTCHMTFDYLLKGSSFEFFKLEISVDGGFTYAAIWEANLINDIDEWIRVYIDLTNYHGETAQFRFFGKRGNSSSGKVSLDNIRFFGSQVSSFPDLIYYVDSDSDGFGNPNQYIPSCSMSPGAGFTFDNTDCVDSDTLINPNAVEVPCNGIDENCNGMEDDAWLPSPVALETVVTVCPHELIEVEVEGEYPVFWYTIPIGGEQININPSPIFQLGNGLQNATNDTLEYIFYASYEEDDCFSLHRTAILVQVLPAPSLSIDHAVIQPVCMGSSIQLSGLPISDSNNLSDSLVFWNVEGQGPLIEPEVVLNQTDSFLLISTSEASCQDSLWFVLETNPNIALEIIDFTEPCGVDVSLEADWSDEVQIMEMVWNTLDTLYSISVSYEESQDSMLFWLFAEDEHGCFDWDSIWVSNDSGIEPLTVHTIDVSSCTSDDGIVQVFSTNPTDSIVFELIHSGSSEIYRDTGFVAQFNDLQGGIYTLTASQLGGNIDCVYEHDELIIINGGQALVEVQSVDAVSCYGFEDGAISIQVEGVDPQINWSTGNTGLLELQNLSEGIYGVTIVDGACSFTISSIEVQEPDSLVLIPMQIDTIAQCHDGHDATAHFTSTGGTDTLIYFWNTIEAMPLRTDLSAGIYDVFVQDINGCASEIFTFEVNNAIPITLDVLVDSTSCFNSSDGSVLVHPMGGTGTYSYVWDSGIGSNTISGLFAGVYGLTVEDSNNCLYEDEIEVFEPASLGIESTIEDASCYGLSDGSASLIASGGNGDYSFLWENGEIISHVSNLAAGNYKFTVTDAQGCTIIESVQIANQEALSFEWDLTPATCDDLSDGILSFYNESGEAPHHFTIFSSMGIVTPEALPTGSLLVRYVDGRGCIDTTLIHHQTSQPIDLQIETELPNCKTSANGQISLIASGPGFPFEYTWPGTASEGPVRTNIPSGYYEVLITDISGCTLRDTIELGAQSNPVIELLGIDSISCSGAADAAIWVDISGGVEPYNFTWNDGVQTKDRLELGPGGYKITAVDSLNCSVESNMVWLTSVPPYQVNIEVGEQEDFPCVNKPVEYMSIQASGGRSPYFASWSDGLDSLFYAHPSPGAYSVLVYDTYGCELLIEGLQVKPDLDTLDLTIDYLIDSTFNCSAILSVDSLVVEISSGTAPFQLNWTGINSGVQFDQSSTESEIITLFEQADWYALTVLDANGCIQTVDSTEITERIPLSLSLISKEDPSCAYIDDGFIDLETSGGLAPFHYTWWHNETLMDLDMSTQTALASGHYEINVVDQLNCSSLISIDLDTINPVEAQFDLIGINYCYGDQNVKVVNLETNAGAIGDYTFNWSDGSTGLPDSLKSGVYALSIVTDDGCVYEQTFEVIASFDGPLVYDETNSNVMDPTCSSEPNGSICVQIDGGTSPYTFDVFNLSSGTSVLGLLGDSLFLDGLSSSQYLIKVYDSLGCALDPIQLPLSANDLLTYEYEIEPVCFNNTGASVELEISGGLEPYVIAWQNSVSTGDSLINLIPDSYLVSITDSVGCKEEFVADLAIGPAIVLESFIAEFQSGSVLGYITTDISGAGLQYYWDTGGNTSFQDGLPVGTYDLIVVDSFGCQEQFSFDLDSTSNIQMVEQLESLKIYPNPTSGNIQIDLPFEFDRDTWGALYDAKGLLLWKEAFNLDTKAIKLPIDLPNGFYILVIQDEWNNLGYTTLVLMR